MQDYITDLENQYQKLLSDQGFQENFTALFNNILHQQPEMYMGLEREIVSQDYPITLYHYKSLHKSLRRLTRQSSPLLIIYAFINRPNILDLQKNRSFIKKLLDNHLDVYLLDWGDPRLEDAQKSLKDYIHDIHQFIQKTKSKKINLLGICQGGTLSLCYASLYPQKINKLITMVTPVDFQHSVLSGLLKNIDTLKLIHHFGNIPGHLLSAGLQALKPFRFLKAANIEQDFFLSMEKWINDCPDHPGLAFHEFIVNFYQKNNLIRGQYFIDKNRIDLSTLRMPILNIYAEKDHLIPPDCSKILKQLTASLNYQEISSPGGHIGVFVSQKSLDTIPIKISEFITS